MEILKKIALAITVVIITACSEDPGEALNIVPERTTVRAFIEAVGVSTRTGGYVIDENTVNEIDLLVFHNGRFHERSPGYDLAPDESGIGYFSTFNVDTYEGNVTFYIVANAREEILNNLPYKGQEMGIVRQDISMVFDRVSEARGYFPMSTIQHYEGGITEEMVLDRINLIRAASKVIVRLDDSKKDQFRLLGVQVFRASNLIQVVPDAITADNKCTQPSVPHIARYVINTMMVPCVDNVMQGDLYVPESVFITEEEATCIVIKGDRGEGERFWRLDFDPQGKWGNGYEVIRNRKYIITIDEINTGGTTEPGEYPDIDPIEGNLRVVGWEEDEYGDPDGYMTVSNDEINLHFYRTSTGMVVIKTNLEDFTVAWCDEYMVQTDPRTAGRGGEIRNEYFRVSVDEEGGYIRATALTDNETNVRTDYIAVTSGNIRFRITINQATRAMRDHINIFNITGVYGNIGDEVMNVHNPVVDPFWRYGAGLKEIIKSEKNFGENGTVPFGGFFIAGLPFQTPLNPYLLELFDVVYIPAATTTVVTDEEAENMSQWVTQDNRVLVVQHDWGYNQNLLGHFGASTTPITLLWGMNYVVADEAPEIFRNGPFGKITGGMQISSPGLAGVLLKEDHPHITPILVSATDPSHIFVGIDFDKRVVFHGDFRLYQRFEDFGGTLTGNGGQIANDHDRFLANLWAWIAETVLGDEYDTELRNP